MKQTTPFQPYPNLYAIPTKVKKWYPCEKIKVGQRAWWSGKFICGSNKYPCVFIIQYKVYEAKFKTLQFLPGLYLYVLPFTPHLIPGLPV